LKHVFIVHDTVAVLVEPCEDLLGQAGGDLEVDVVEDSIELVELEFSVSVFVGLLRIERRVAIYFEGVCKSEKAVKSTIIDLVLQSFNSVKEAIGKLKS
jgi:hypothetical protein